MAMTTSVQVLTHCDPSRAIRACMLANSVPPEIAVLCAVNGEMEEVVLRLSKTGIPKHLSFIPAASRYPYPANALRNLAMSRATANWVFYVDCDFVFCRDFWSILFQRYGALLSRQTPTCFCPPALWDPNGAYLLVDKTDDLLLKETFDSHCPPRNWEETSRAQLFKHHQSMFDNGIGPDSMPYDFTPRMRRLRRGMPGEPWGMLPRKACVWADEDFGAGPLDKQQFVSALLDRGVEFWAIPDLFLFHLWHPYRDGTDGLWPDAIRNRVLWARRYATTFEHRYILIGIGGVLPPRLPEFISQNLPYKYATGSDPAIQGSADQPSDTQAVDDRVVITRSIVAMRSGQPVVIGPRYLAREVLGYGYRTCVFFRSPAFYRSRDRGSQAIREDGYYVQLFTGTTNVKDAVSQLDNVSMLFDAGEPLASVRSLRNILGCSVPQSVCEPLIGEHVPPDDTSDRIQHRSDYLLYDYARVLAGLV